MENDTQFFGFWQGEIGYTLIPENPGKIIPDRHETPENIERKMFSSISRTGGDLFRKRLLRPGSAARAAQTVRPLHGDALLDSQLAAFSHSPLRSTSGKQNLTRRRTAC